MRLSLLLDDWLTLFNSAVIVQIFNPTAKRAITTGTITNEGTMEIEIQPLTAETETRTYSN